MPTKVAAHLLPLLKERRSEEDSILTVDGAAGLLKVSKLQIYQLVDKSQNDLGTFPFYEMWQITKIFPK